MNHQISTHMDGFYSNGQPFLVRNLNKFARVLNVQSCACGGNAVIDNYGGEHLKCDGCGLSFRMGDGLADSIAYWNKSQDEYKQEAVQILELLNKCWCGHTPVYNHIFEFIRCPHCGTEVNECTPNYYLSCVNAWNDKVRTKLSRIKFKAELRGKSLVKNCAYINAAAGNKGVNYPRINSGVSFL